MYCGCLVLQLPPQAFYFKIWAPHLSKTQHSSVSSLFEEAHIPYFRTKSVSYRWPCHTEQSNSSTKPQSKKAGHFTTRIRISSPRTKLAIMEWYLEYLVQIELQLHCSNSVSKKKSSAYSVANSDTTHWLKNDRIVRWNILIFFRDRAWARISLRGRKHTYLVCEKLNLSFWVLFAENSMGRT